MLPLRYCELMQRFHFTAYSSALTFFFTVIAPQIGRISATPHLGIEHVFGMPIAAPLALFLFTVAGESFFASFAQMFPILAFPLPF